MVAPFDSFTKEDADSFYLRDKAHPSRYRCSAIVGDARVLDLGCGRALDLQKLYSKEQYTGVDCSKALIDKAREDNPGYTLICSEILAYLEPLPDNSFEYGLIQSILEHVESLAIAQEIYREAARVCETLLVVWHMPPRYGYTRIERVPAPDMREMLFQNRYEEGSFDYEDIQVELERVDNTELWTVHRR